MANKWTVPPETVKLDLIDPRDGEAFWVTIKKRLTVGETKYVNTAGMKSVSGFQSKPGVADADREMSMQIDWKRQGLARAEMYIVAWSLADEHGTPLAVNRDIIEALSPEVFDVIENGITGHVVAMEKEKKAPAGDSRPPATSN